VRIFGLDLRNIPAVENFARHMLESEPSIDILIHNAAQTIRRPKGFYRDLVAMEQNPQAALPGEALRLVVQGAPSTLAISDSNDLLPSLLPEGHEPTATDILPADSLYDNEERADSRDTNSWMLKLDQVGPQEMLEVQLVNSVAPFLLNSRLKPLLLRAPFERRFIVNVSAMEGQFARNKTVYHPHTNMAKAALNMMTRTSGDDYARDGIYMTSVDTGWVTDEVPGPQRLRKQAEKGFFAPLDIVDGMARIYHPVAEGLNDPKTPYFGVFLKDYGVTPW
jgi:NAD(P)-dependent dehydrogenase (short-subunit alcohol dehydrogenase family)